MMEQKLTFEFTVDEINAILGALGNVPYAQVAGIIDNIRQQAAPQVGQAAPTTPVTPTE
jgi:hypothetical protein